MKELRGGNTKLGVKKNEGEKKRNL